MVPIDFEEATQHNDGTGQKVGSQHLRGALIEIENLSFRYPSRPDVPVLNNFNLTVPPGSVVAIVGSSGSGKSTIGSLLTRLYDAHYNDGAVPPIRINGKSIRDYDTQDLRQMIGIVSQDPVLFQGSIRDNIRYGMWDKVSDDDVTEAARQAFVLDFANSFPDGLDTMVGPRGVMLSGGQRQRIAIARMLANRNAPIYILDEVSDNQLYWVHGSDSVGFSRFRVFSRRPVPLMPRVSTLSNPRYKRFLKITVGERSFRLHTV